MLKNLKRPGIRSELFFHVSLKEKIILCIKGSSIVALVDFCFYRSIAAAVCLFPVGYWFYQMEKKELIHKKKEEAGMQFKELLLLTVAGQKAGYSVENAFLKNYEDMSALYGRESYVCLMLREVKNGLNNHLSVSDLWKKIGECSDIAEIREFSEVFSIAKESGGNMTAVMERTAETISSKAETRKEIETLLSARRLEQKIMNIMPFFLIIYVNFTSPDYFSGFYHSLQGVIIMTFCFLVYISAYLLGYKIAAVEV